MPGVSSTVSDCSCRTLFGKGSGVVVSVTVFPVSAGVSSAANATVEKGVMLRLTAIIIAKVLFIMVFIVLPPIFYQTIPAEPVKTFTLCLYYRIRGVSKSVTTCDAFAKNHDFQKKMHEKKEKLYDFSLKMVENRRIELLTPCVQGRCSPS